MMGFGDGEDDDVVQIKEICSWSRHEIHVVAVGCLQCSPCSFAAPVVASCHSVSGRSYLPSAARAGLKEMQGDPSFSVLLLTLVCESSSFYCWHLSTGQPFLLLKCRDCSAAFCFSKQNLKIHWQHWIQAVNTVKPSALGVPQCARAVLSCFALPLPPETRSSSQHPAFSCPCRFLKSSKYRFSLILISLIDCI